MCSVVLRKHEQPTKTIQIAVVGMAGSCLGVGLGRELGNEASGRGVGLSGEAFDARPCDRGRGRTGLPRGARRSPLRQAEADEGHPALDDEEVGRHLTKPPVVVRPLAEVGVGRPGYPNEECVPLRSCPRDE
jgi:hypothetical protein